MIDLFKNAFWYITEGTCTVLLHMLKYILGLQGAYEEAVRISSCFLTYIPDHFKRGEMSHKAVHINPRLLGYVPNHFKTKDVQPGSAHKPLLLACAPDHFKTQEMCNEAAPQTIHDVICSRTT